MFKNLKIFSAIFWLTSLNCYSAPDGDFNDLQKQCERTANAEFRKVWGDGTLEDIVKNNFVSANYKSHFNTKLNKCFYLLSTSTISKKSTRNITFGTEQLTDINKNKEYGSYMGDYKLIEHCKVDDTVCGSKAEFEELIKHYLEE
jgi:hypothetical protein